MKVSIKNLAATVLERLSGNSTIAQRVKDEADKEHNPGGGAALDAIVTVPSGEI